MSARVFIDGAAGTTGLQIADRLAGRADLRLITLDAGRRKDAAARAEALNAADIAILCLPDEAAREAVALVTNPATRIIDASTAHRTAAGWTYGFPELVGREAVANARRVANPGCYPTGFLALVAPLVRAGVLPADAALACHAASGYSGGGKAMIADYEGSGGAPSAFAPYALGLAHKHLPEMRTHAGLAHPPVFTPAVAPVYAGMIVAVPLHASQLTPGQHGGSVRETLARAYAGSPVISLADAPPGATLPIETMAESDAMRLFVLASADEAQLVLIAALDNLGKGASGAAVQSLNLMLGLPETTGLRL